MPAKVDISSINFTDEQLIADLTKDTIKISEDLIAKAQENDAKTQASIGSLYIKEKIFDKAYAWFLKSARQGNADAQYELAQGFSPLYYWDDPNAEVDLSREWCQKAVDQGHADAHGLMGYITDQDTEVASESLPWYHQAVFLGAKDWQNNIDEWESMGPRYKLRPAEIKKARSAVMKWYKKDKTPSQIIKALEQENRHLQDQLQEKEDLIKRLFNDLDENYEKINRLEEEVTEMYEHEEEARQLRERVKYLEHKHREDIKNQNK